MNYMQKKSPKLTDHQYSFFYTNIFILTAIYSSIINYIKQLNSDILEVILIVLQIIYYAVALITYLL